MQNRALSFFRWNIDFVMHFLLITFHRFITFLDSVHRRVRNYLHCLARVYSFFENALRVENLSRGARESGTKGASGKDSVLEWLLYFDPTTSHKTEFNAKEGLSPCEQITPASARHRAWSFQVTRVRWSDWNSIRVLVSRHFVQA